MATRKGATPKAVKPPWAAKAAAMKEKGLDLKVRKLLNDLGLAPFSMHPPDGVGRTCPGWPDWTILGSRTLYRELKTETGRLSPAQKLVIAHLEAVGADVAVWRPRDLYSGRIAEELAAVADIGTRARAGELKNVIELERAKQRARNPEAAGRRRPGGAIRRRAA